VFGSLALAFGMMFIVTPVLVMAGRDLRAFPIIQALGWVGAAMVGQGGIVSGMKIVIVSIPF